MQKNLSYSRIPVQKFRKEDLYIQYNYEDHHNEGHYNEDHHNEEYYHNETILMKIIITKTTTMKIIITKTITMKTIIMKTITMKTTILQHQAMNKLLQNKSHHVYQKHAHLDIITVLQLVICQWVVKMECPFLQ